jgi:hypothetical protein
VRRLSNVGEAVTPPPPPNDGKIGRESLIIEHAKYSNKHLQAPVDLSPYEWNFDLDKPGQKFHLSLKEHHKISNIPKFRYEML